MEYASPLMYAVLSSSKEIARFLLEQGADVDLINSGGATALMIAAVMDNRVLVNLLLAFGASLDYQLEDTTFLLPPGAGSRGKMASLCRWLPGETQGATALWLASCGGKEAAVELLLGAGADSELEASCESLPSAGDREYTCGPHRAAELQKRKGVMDLFAGSR